MGRQSGLDLGHRDTLLHLSPGVLGLGHLPQVWLSWGQQEARGNPQTHQEGTLSPARPVSSQTAYPSNVPLGQACHLFFTPVIFKGATGGCGCRTGPMGAESRIRALGCVLCGALRKLLSLPGLSFPTLSMIPLGSESVKVHCIHHSGARACQSKGLASTDDTWATLSQLISDP